MELPGNKSRGDAVLARDFNALVRAVARTLGRHDRTDISLREQRLSPLLVPVIVRAIENVGSTDPENPPRLRVARVWWAGPPTLPDFPASVIDPDEQSIAYPWGKWPVEAFTHYLFPAGTIVPDQRTVMLAFNASIHLRVLLSPMELAIDAPNPNDLAPPCS